MDLVILVSDNQLWGDGRATGPTETPRLWYELKVNPDFLWPDPVAFQRMNQHSLSEHQDQK